MAALCCAMLALIPLLLAIFLPLWVMVAVPLEPGRSTSPWLEIREGPLLVFAGIHPMEWVSIEVAATWLEELAEHPPEGVEVVVVPVVNLDRRLAMEEALREGNDRYFRVNANNTDLNRDFAVNRESKAVWRHLIPGRYAVSEAPLSQPETQALDALAGREDFDVVVSLHAFGGFIYTPWAGLWARIPKEDRAEHVRLGEVMAHSQGAFAY